MRLRDIKGMAVVNLDTAEKTGTLSDVILDLAAGQVVGFQFRSGMDKTFGIIPITQLHYLGQDALTYRGTALPMDAIPTDQTRRERVVSHVKAINASGHYLGVVTGVHFDRETLRILAYTVRKEGLFHRSQTIIADKNIRFGPDLAIIPDTAVVPSSLPQDVSSRTPAGHVPAPLG